MPCTTILVGKNASFDGSTLMARNEDSGAGRFCPKKFVVITPENQPVHYKSVKTGVDIELPEEPQRYTSMPDAVNRSGIWAEAGINESNVAMSATETITSNPRVLGADPLVNTGIGEEDMVTIVLPYINSAREGVVRLGALLEKYGTYEMNGIGFQDVNEIWWMETIGGHHWIAKRVPDDAYVVGPNQLGIDSFNIADALSAKKNHMCSSDLAEFIAENHLDLSLDNDQFDAVTDFDARAAFGSHSDSDHIYNTPRAWFMEKYLNPTTYRWEGPNADFTPCSDDIPWCLIPEKKITIEDIKYVLSSYYQGTEYDPYDKFSAFPGKFRPIGINRNNFVAVTQLRPYKSESIMAIEWIAEGSNAFNTLVPFYANVTVAPEYLSNATGLVTTENFYWANRIIAALADAHYGKCIADIWRYEQKVMAKGWAMIKEYDAKGEKLAGEEVSALLEEFNEKNAEFVKAETYDLLDKVLFAASNDMKNAFSMSDH